MQIWYVQNLVLYVCDVEITIFHDDNQILCCIGPNTFGFQFLNFPKSLSFSKKEWQISINVCVQAIIDKFSHTYMKKTTMFLLQFGHCSNLKKYKFLQTSPFTFAIGRSECKRQFCSLLSYLRFSAKETCVLYCCFLC